MKKILIIGKNGQVGWELQRSLATLGQLIVVGRNDLNLADTQVLAKFVREVRPSIIVNAAAYTAVDLAEKEPETAMAVNATAPGVLATEALKLNALLVHYSTDYVFNGQSSTAYHENDITDPINAYGKTKRAGELAIQQVDCRHLILRTSWVYGTRGKNFLLTMLRLAKEKDQLRIVQDQVGAPTWSRNIAEATLQLLTHQDGPSGIYHLTSAGNTSWHGFAEAIFKLYQKQCNPDFRIPQLSGIASNEYPTPASRPKNSRLDNTKIQTTFGCYMPEWETALSDCLYDMRPH